MIEIIKNLWVGSYYDANNEKEIKLNNIKCILNFASECNKPVFCDSSYNYKKYDLIDHGDEKINEHFMESGCIINNNLKKDIGVLIYCRMGYSRSVTIIIAYLMNYGFDIEEKKKNSYSDCFCYVKEKHKLASPNLGFCIQLRELDMKNGFRNDISDCMSSSRSSPLFQEINSPI